MVGHRLDEVMIVVVVEASSQESVPQSRRSCPNGPSLPIEYKGNEDESTLST